MNMDHGGEWCPCPKKYGRYKENTTSRFVARELNWYETHTHKPTKREHLSLFLSLSPRSGSGRGIMAAAAGVMAILESTYNSLDLEAILELYADDARFSAHCEFIAPPLIVCLVLRKTSGGPKQLMHFYIQLQRFKLTMFSFSKKKYLGWWE